MMFQLPPLKVNLPKPKFRKQEVITEDGQRVKCRRRDTFLDMSQMSLILFPTMALRCDQLHTLILNRNFIRSIPRQIRLLNGLEVLDLSYNKMHEFPDAILPLLSLTELDMSHNILQNISLDIRYLKKMRILNLSNNRIKRLPNGMQHLSSLASLDVSSNKLEEYPLDLCNCFSKLTKLRCSYNLITVVPYEIIYLAEGCLVDKNGVDFTHNPLNFPPTDVVAKGFEAMRNYIEPKWRDQKEFKRRKVVQQSQNTAKTNITKTDMWDKNPAETSGINLVSKKKKRQPLPATKKDTPNAKKAQQTNNVEKVEKTKKEGRKKRDDLSELKIDTSAEDSSQATLVEVYGTDGVTPVNQLSPLPDSCHPANTPADYDLSADSFSNYDDDEPELLDITQSFEPPDLDLPDTMNLGTGGGMLEQWLGCVHSMTQSPTTQAPSCGSTETSNAALNPFTPFSDVKITKNAGSSSSDEAGYQCSDKEEVVDGNECNTPITPQLSVSEQDTMSCRNSLSTPVPMTPESKKKDELPLNITKPTRNSLSRGRRGSNQSFQSSVSDTNTITRGKKKKRKKKKKKEKTEESELELYSRIPFKPLLITRRHLPNVRGLKTWAYFTEPKSCYLIDNMTEISSSTKRVRFGTDEVTVMRSNPSTTSLVTGSCLANNFSNSTLDRTGSVHSVDSNHSQLLSASAFSMSQRSNFSSNNLVDEEISRRSVLSSVGRAASADSSAGAWSGSNLSNSRPASLPAPRHHTWTSEDLQRYIYKPPDLIIPPKVLISYLRHDTDTVNVKHIKKLSNTLESNGLAECVCAHSNLQSDYDFKELGYFDWLNEQIEECEYVIMIMSEHYLRSLPLLNKLAGSNSSYRDSPYITPADVKRWGIGLGEAQRRFIPVFHDDVDTIHTSTWLQVTPFFIPSEICELGYHLISRDSRESVIIPNIFDMEESITSPDLGNNSKVDIATISNSEICTDKPHEPLTISPDVFRVLPVTAHLLVFPQDLPPDWRLEEIAGKLRYHWKDFARTCGFDSELISEIDSVYNGSLNKSVQCLRTWKSQLVGNASYDELARRLGQIDQKHIADAYCNFQGSF